MWLTQNSAAFCDNNEQRGEKLRAAFQSFSDQTENEKNSRKTLDSHNLFEDVAADTWHPDAERKLVAEPSAKLHHLQLARLPGPIQGHGQQSTDPCRTNTHKMPQYIRQMGHVIEAKF